MIILNDISVKRAEMNEIVYIDASYNDLVAAIGKPSNIYEDHDKVNAEWHIWAITENEEVQAVDVYDYKENFNPLKSRNKSLLWHIKTSKEMAYKVRKEIYNKILKNKS